MEIIFRTCFDLFPPILTIQVYNNKEKGQTAERSSRQRWMRKEEQEEEREQTEEEEEGEDEEDGRGLKKHLNNGLM